SFALRYSFLFDYKIDNYLFFFFSSRRRHTRFSRDWSSDVCSSDLTTEDMIDIFKKAGLRVSKGEIGAFLRKAGHKNYKECLDNFARNFLKGLAIKYRG